MSAPTPCLVTGPTVPLHFGGLHPYETALAVFVAFAPFVVLAVVIVLRRRQDAADEAAEERAEQADRPAPPG